MKRYALLLLLVVGLSTSAWGYGFTSPPGSCWTASSCWTSSSNLYPILNPCIGFRGNYIAFRPNIWCGPMWQSSCNNVSYQGVSVYQAHFGNQYATTCQNSINLEIHRSCTQSCGGPPQGNCQP